MTAKKKSWQEKAKAHNLKHRKNPDTKNMSDEDKNTRHMIKVAAENRRQQKAAKAKVMARVKKKKAKK